MIVFAILLLIVRIVRASEHSNEKKGIEVTFQLVGPEGEAKHQYSFGTNRNVSIEVVNICRLHRIRAPGCLVLFRKALAQKVNLDPPESGSEIIDTYSAFSNLYAQYAQEMDGIIPISDEFEEFASPYNLYYAKRADMAVERLVLCISHFQEDLSWLRTTRTRFMIVTKNTSPRFNGHAVQISVNRGNEVSSYLRFISDYYDVLPEFTMFLHGHNQDWHQYYPVSYIVEHLQFQKGFESINNVMVFPYDDKPKRLLKEMWPVNFQDELGDHPENGFRDKCCAQFVVHRDRIRLRSRAFYQRLYDYVIADGQDDAGEGDGYHHSMSYVVEMVWHYIFGEPAHMDYSQAGSQFTLSTTSTYNQTWLLYV
jgi:hypothetical protein